MNMSKKEIPDFTQNRELSWLRFNQRVLEEARDESVPLMERMKFVAIFTSNLDEFFDTEPYPVIFGNFEHIVIRCE